MGRGAWLAAAWIAVPLGGCGEEEPARSDAAPSRAPVAAAATATPAAEPGRPRRYKTLAGAVAAIDRRTDVPVVVPQNLPDDLRFATGSVHGRGGSLIFLAPKRRALVIEYGRAGFDGCGPLHPRETRVGTAPAVINVSRPPDRPHVAVVWPATVEKPAGRYGLSGPFPKAQIMRFAESMQAQGRAVRRARRARGC